MVVATVAVVVFFLRPFLVGRASSGGARSLARGGCAAWLGRGGALPMAMLVFFGWPWGFAGFLLSLGGILIITRG